MPERGKIFRSTLCEQCGTEVRVCRNCEFYAPGLHWDCRETVREPVRDKDRANFCEFFRPRSGGGNHAGVEKDDQARDNFQQLFGNG